ncbi:MAG: hypothetical protein H6872_01030 [Methylobacteriaceae bacterium]|nr:hypothetical protein [Methylobacteriaceae bacterium]
MKNRIALAFALALVPAAACAETWMVVEGADGKVKGAWTVNVAGAAINGAAAMKNERGMAVTYKVAGDNQNGNYVIQRIQPSDGVACTYVGKAAGPKAINGTAKCGRDSAQWSAVKTN